MRVEPAPEGFRPILAGVLRSPVVAAALRRIQAVQTRFGNIRP